MFAFEEEYMQNVRIAIGGAKYVSAACTQTRRDAAGGVNESTNARLST